MVGACFQVAGFRIGTDMPLDQFQIPHLKRYLLFQSSDEEPDAVLSVRPNAWDLCSDMANPRPMCRIDGPQVVFWRGDFALTCDFRSRPWRCKLAATGENGGFDAAARILNGLDLVYRGGGLFHSSAARAPQGVIMFSGEAGAGKSTAVRNRPAGTELLSDEMVAICPNGSEYFAYATPFGGDFEPSPIAGPLRRMFFISHGNDNQTERLDGREALRELLKALYLCPINAGVADLALTSLGRLMSRIPVERIHARRDGSFWPKILAEGTR